MLSNAYFVAKFRFDTAENEPAKICEIFENAFFENAFFENAFFEKFAIFWRARSRLYQNEILQENMRLSRFDSIFQALQDLHSFAPLQSQNFRKKSV